jgi:hypothetical protein
LVASVSKSEVVQALMSANAAIKAKKFRAP